MNSSSRWKRMARLASAGSIFVVACASDRGDGEATSADTAARVSAADSRDSIPYELAWLAEGSTEQRFLKVARHFRGLDQAMIEIGYRYEELYWAGRCELAVRGVSAAEDPPHIGECGGAPPASGRLRLDARPTAG